jgi:uncharacterized repeat protein (TIGR03803 family)
MGDRALPPAETYGNARTRRMNGYNQLDPGEKLMQPRKSSFALNIVKGAAVMFVMLSAFGAFAGAQTTYTENTIYTFGTQNNPDGMNPLDDGLVFDKAGNLYGTTRSDSGYGYGAVFELTPNGSGGWTETVLHFFNPQSTTNLNDGAAPGGSLAIDSKGNLYGTTTAGGANGTGIVWELSPPTVKGNPWTETILYSFGAPGSGDGYGPVGGITLGNSSATVLYGTTECGGSGASVYGSVCYPNNMGTVYQLTYVKKTKTVPAHWTETILHSFSGPDGADPQGGLLLSGGDLYGWAGYTGVIFELTHSAGGWTETVLASLPWQSFYGAPVMDAQKNLYVTTPGAGTYGSGAVWELAYSATTKTYTEQVIYSFNTGSEVSAGLNWGLVYSKGSLFGATTGGAGEGIPSYAGSVFELTYTKPTKKAPGGWQETDINQFAFLGGAADGDGPGLNELIMDSKGNLYGMLLFLSPDGGGGGVFELSPSTE